MNRLESGLAQLAQEHQQREGELQPAPIPEDVPRDPEVPSEPEGEHEQADDGSDAPGSQDATTRALLRRDALRWHRIIHGEPILPWRRLQRRSAPPTPVRGVPQRAASVKR